MIFYDLKNVPFPRYLFSEINQLEKSPWKTGGGIHVTLFLLYDHAGRRKPNFILVGMLHLGWFFWGGGEGKVTPKLRHYLTILLRFSDLKLNLLRFCSTNRHTVYIISERKET